jgi:hypothetical protein
VSAGEINRELATRKRMFSLAKKAGKLHHIAGVPRSAAMAMVGHKTESIYRRYAIVDAGVLRDAAARIDLAAGPLASVRGTISGTTTSDQAAEPIAESA